MFPTKFRGEIWNAVLLTVYIRTDATFLKILQLLLLLGLHTSVLCLAWIIKFI